MVDHSDRNIDTTFWGELFEVRLSAGSRRAEGRWVFSLWVLEKSLKSPGIKPARWGVTESLVSKNCHRLHCQNNRNVQLTSSVLVLRL